MQLGFEGSYLWRIRQRVGHDMLLVPAAGVILVNAAEKVLLLRRRDTDEWCTPGGSAEPGGSFAATAIIELREETGISVDRSDLVPFATVSTVDDHVVHYPKGAVIHAFALWFVARRWSGTPDVNLEESTDMGFFSCSELPSPMMRGSARALQRYEAYLLTGNFQSD